MKYLIKYNTLKLNTEITEKNLLKELNTKYDLTIIMISHQINVIEKICNKVAILDHASIVEVGTTQDVFLSPKTDIAKKIIYNGGLDYAKKGRVYRKKH